MFDAHVRAWAAIRLAELRELPEPPPDGNPEAAAFVRAWQERRLLEMIGPVSHADIIRRVWSKRMPGQWAGPDHPDD